MIREMGDALGLFANVANRLLLEDLHWADSSSIELLRHLCNRISSQRVCWLVHSGLKISNSNHPLKSCRAEMKMHKLCEEIPLDSLNRDHIVDYLNATFSERLSFKSG